MQEFEYKEQYKYLSAICLCITDACNLACKYCFVEQHPNFMSLQTAKDIADWLYNNCQIKIKNNWVNEKEKCKINFFGGEPMLLFDEVIKPLIEYCKEKNYEIDWGMTTNGTLLDEEKIKYLFDNKVGLLLSIDGFKETQDYNRPCRNGESSFDKIFQNIPYILKYYPNITFRSTIYEDTVEHCFENYLFAEKMGFKSYFCTPDVMSKKWSEEKLKILEEQIHQIFEYRLMQYLNNKKPMEFSKINENFSNFKKLFYDIPGIKGMKNTDLLKRCGLGTGLGAIGYDGSIYGCQEWTSRKNENIYYIGNIYKGGIDIKRHTKLLKTYYDSLLNQKPENNICNNKDCIMYDFCQEYYNPGCICHSQNFDTYNNMEIISPIFCRYNQILFKESLITFQTLIENDNQLFKEYFSILTGRRGFK